MDPDCMRWHEVPQGVNFAKLKDDFSCSDVKWPDGIKECIGQSDAEAAKILAAHKPQTEEGKKKQKNKKKEKEKEQKETAGEEAQRVAEIVDEMNLPDRLAKAKNFDLAAALERAELTKAEVGRTCAHFKIKKPKDVLERQGSRERARIRRVISRPTPPTPYPSTCRRMERSPPEPDQSCYCGAATLPMRPLREQRVHRARARRRVRSKASPVASVITPPLRKKLPARIIRRSSMPLRSCAKGPASGRGFTPALLHWRKL